MDTLTGPFDPPMLRKIEASDGGRGDDFKAENEAGYSPSGDHVPDFDVDRTDSRPVLDLFARRALGIRGNTLGYRGQLPGEDPYPRIGSTRTAHNLVRIRKREPERRS